MARNKISDLRDHLFETIEALKDPDNPMDIERANAISGVAKTIIETAKVEVDMLRVVGGDIPEGGFFHHIPESRALPGRTAGSPQPERVRALKAAGA